MAEERIQRRLATILAADVVGFSRLMEADESGTLRALKSRHNDVLDPLVARHQGRIFKVTGDGVLVEFGSAVNALQCAVDLQQAMAAANGDQSNDRHIVLRIGINLGDVMVEGSDLYGDGINIAARLEAIAEPGGILVSGTAYDHIKNKVKVGFDDLGAQALKNIAESVRTYRVTGTPRVSPVVTKATADKPSIALLPFVNMSGDPTQDFFVDGITENIITGLSRFRDLFVIASNSTFAYKGKAARIQDNSGGSGDKLIFGEGLLSSEAVFSRAGESLTVGFKGSTDSVTIVDQFSTAGANIRGYEVEELHFADGKIWTRSDIELTFLQSTAGNDSLHGFGDANTLDGGLGNDTLNGDTNHDTYLFGLGGGQDVIDDEGDTGGGSDRLVFGAGIAAGDLRLSKSGDNAILEIVGTDDRVTIENQFALAPLGTQIAEIQFADSTVWDYATFTGFYKQGTSGANSITGSVNANYIDGLGGADTLTGGQGHDTYVVDNAGDKVVEAANEGFDTVESNVTHTLAANVENLIITGTSAISGTGNELANLIIGSAGNNTLDGGAGGTDTLRGGFGNDTYIVAALDDVIVELSGEGTDTVSSSIDYTLTDNVENLVLTGSATVGTGNSGGNVITGTSAADSISGLDGDDTLDSGAGSDTLAGGKGNDTYVYDGTDTIAEAADEGADTVQFGSTLDLNTLSNVENLTLTGSSAVNGTGTSANNSIIGNTGTNKLLGNDGSDTLNGGTGADTLEGGTGDDVYIVDNTKDIVTEASGAGFDSIQSSVDYMLSADVENLTLTGTSIINATGNALSNVLTGNGMFNELNGGDGVDTLIGGKGNDQYIVDTITDVIIEIAGEGTDTVESSVTFSLAALATVENLTLLAGAIDGTGNALANFVNGNSAANHLNGAEGNDVLSGGSGADTMTGGVGDDTYIIDNVSDVVVESDGEGIDSVKATVTYTLAAPLENLLLDGGSGIHGTGNDADNVITGNNGANKLSGGLGNDTLDGDSGSDTLTGGIGNDVYVINVAGDAVTELAGEGADTVKSTISYTLGSTLENLTLTVSGSINGTGNDADNKILGHTGANSLSGGLGSDTLDGSSGADSMSGGVGNDTYFVDSASDVVAELSGEGTDTVQSFVAYALGSELENLQLLGTSNINGTGNALNNSLTGNTGMNSLSGGDGDDTLDGGAGIDTLTGGIGNDLYLHGRGAGGDVISNGDAAGMDALRFGTDVDVHQIWFAQSGNDLKISVIGTSDVATIQGWYAGASNQLDEIRTTDGNMVLDYSEVQQLVDAMAAFTPPPSGQLTLSQEVRDVLTPTISATWQAAA